MKGTWDGALQKACIYWFTIQADWTVLTALTIISHIV